MLFDVLLHAVNDDDGDDVVMSLVWPVTSIICGLFLSYVSIIKMLRNYALLTDILLFCRFDTL